MAKRLRRTITITIVETWTLRWGEPGELTECASVEECLVTDNRRSSSGRLNLRHRQPDVIQFVARSSSQTTIAM